MGADTHALHKDVSPAKMREALVVLSLRIVVIHLGHEPRAVGVGWSEHLDGHNKCTSF